MPAAQTAKSGSPFQAVLASVSQDTASGSGAKDRGTKNQGVMDSAGADSNTTASDAKTGTVPTPAQGALSLSDTKSRTNLTVAEATVTTSLPGEQKSITPNTSSTPAIVRQSSEEPVGSSGVTKEKHTRAATGSTAVPAASLATIASGAIATPITATQLQGMWQPMLLVAAHGEASSSNPVVSSGKGSSDASAKISATTTVSEEQTASSLIDGSSNIASVSQPVLLPKKDASGDASSVPAQAPQPSAEKLQPKGNDGSSSTPEGMAAGHLSSKADGKSAIASTFQFASYYSEFQTVLANASATGSTTDSVAIAGVKASNESSVASQAVTPPQLQQSASPELRVGSENNGSYSNLVSGLAGSSVGQRSRTTWVEQAAAAATSTAKTMSTLPTASAGWSYTSMQITSSAGSVAGANENSQATHGGQGEISRLALNNGNRGDSARGSATSTVNTNATNIPDQPTASKSTSMSNSMPTTIVTTFSLPQTSHTRAQVESSASSATDIASRKNASTHDAPNAQDHNQRTDAASLAGGSSTSFAVTSDARVSNDSSNKQQLPALQSVPDTTAPVKSASAEKQPNAAAPIVSDLNADAIAIPPSVNLPGSDSAIAVQDVGGTIQAAVLPDISPVVTKESNNVLNGSQPVGKAASKAASSSNEANSSDTANTSTATAKTAATNGTHAAQSDGQPAQNSQTDSSQATATPKATDSAVTQLQPVIAHATTHDTVASNRVPDSTSNTTHTSDEQLVPSSVHLDSGEAVVPSSINAARLIQTMNGSEMRVGMHSSEFGEISIRTSVSQQQMTTQISVDHGDLSQALSAHISAAQTRLGDEHGLHASIEVNNQGSALAGDSEHSSQREQRASTTSPWNRSSVAAAEIDKGTGMTALVGVGDERRLDIRA